MSAFAKPITVEDVSIDGRYFGGKTGEYHKSSMTSATQEILISPTGSLNGAAQYQFNYIGNSGAAIDLSQSYILTSFTTQVSTALAPQTYVNVNEMTPIALAPGASDMMFQDAQLRLNNVKNQDGGDAQAFAHMFLEQTMVPCLEVMKPMVIRSTLLGEMQLMAAAQRWISVYRAVWARWQGTGRTSPVLPMLSAEVMGLLMLIMNRRLDLHRAGLLYDISALPASALLLPSASCTRCQTKSVYIALLCP